MDPYHVWRALTPECVAACEERLDASRALTPCRGAVMGLLAVTP